MDKVKYYIEKYKIIIAIIIFLILLIIFLVPKSNKDIEEVSIVKSDEIEEIEAKENLPKKIKIDIKGSVVSPGVYELEEGTRVQDAINKAGGLSENANIEYINLSKKLSDEMVIIIYSNEYIEDYKNKDKEAIYIKYECDCPDKYNDACVKEENVLNETKEDKKTEKSSEKVENQKTLISINTATLEELMTLNGIGESKAKAIIEYREQNGGFKSIDEIMNVSGIGESAYSKIKDNIEL